MEASWPGWSSVGLTQRLGGELLRWRTVLRRRRVRGHVGITLRGAVGRRPITGLRWWKRLLVVARRRRRSEETRLRQRRRRRLRSRHRRTRSTGRRRWDQRGCRCLAAEDCAAHTAKTRIRRHNRTAIRAVHHTPLWATRSRNPRQCARASSSVPKPSPGFGKLCCATAAAVRPSSVRQRATCRLGL